MNASKESTKHISLMILALKIINCNSCSANSTIAIGEKIQLDAASEVFNASNISSLWIRKDPPVDENYVRDLIIFEQFSHQIHFINHRY